MKRLTKVLAITSTIILVFAVVLGSTMFTLIYRNAGPIESTAPTVSSDNAFTTETRSPESDTLPNQQETTSVPGTTSAPMTTGTPTTEAPPETTAHEHSFGEWTVGETPTCRHEGDQYHSCTKCGYREHEIIPIVDHEYVNHFCKYCSKLERNVELTPSEGFEFTLSADKTYYILSGKGTFTDRKVIIPSTHNGLPVAEIGKSALAGTYYTGIYIPGSVKVIGEKAFYTGSSLNSSAGTGELVIDEGVITISKNAFDGQIFIGKILFPQSLEYIGDFAFYNCSSVKTIEFPDSMTDIGNAAFRYCQSLKSVKFPSGISEIKTEVFYGCDLLESVYIPESVTKIGGGAFYYCESLVDIRFSENLNEIGSSAFSQCVSLEKIILPKSLKILGTGAFYSCDKIKYISAPGIEVVKKYAFGSCRSLEVVDLAPSLREFVYDYQSHVNTTCFTAINIGNGKYYKSVEGIVFTADGKKLVAYPEGKPETEYTVPDGVVEIGDYVFKTTTHLKKLVIPGSVKKIGSYVLMENALTELIFSEPGLESIGEYSFQSMDIKELNLPNTLKTIGYRSFMWCKNLERLEIPDSVTYVGSDAFEFCDALSYVKFSANQSRVGGMRDCRNLRVVVIPNGIKTISWEAFKGCYNLTSISIPDSVTYIGMSAFEGCTKAFINVPPVLTYVGEKAFYGCYQITEVNSVGKDLAIGDNAFYGCSKLKKVNVTGVKSIGDYAFYKCSALESFSASGSSFAIGEHAFNTCTSLASVKLTNVTSIGSKCFWRNTKLKSIEFPKSLTFIGESAFENCGSLTYVSAPGVKEIGASAFLGTALNKIDLTDTLTVIGDSAFKGCAALTYINAQGVQKVGTEAFHNCKALEKLVLSSSVESISGDMFAGCESIESIDIGDHNSYKVVDGVIYSSDGKQLVYYPSGKDEKEYTVLNGVETIGTYAFNNSVLESILLPEGLKIISKYAFDGCRSLQEITLPDSVTALYEGAFQYCSSLKKVPEFPESLKYITKNAFKGCTSIKELVVPDHIEVIADGAFWNTGLEKITFLGETTLYVNVFYGCSSVEVLEILGKDTCVTTSMLVHLENLKTVIVSDDNNYYKVVDNILFSKSGQTLYLYPRGKQETSYTIPDGVKTIYKGAFTFNTTLEEIVLPNNSCTLEEHSMRGCKNLKNIVYQGTRTEWKNLKNIRDDWNWQCGEIKIICTDGTVTVPANKQ